jgi:RNA polymerase sigma-70 factor (ECF subfamily)
VLFSAHHAALSRFLLRMLGSRETAADMAQECFLRLLSAVRGRPVDNERGLLFTIAANLARDHLRQQGRRPMVHLDTVSHSLPLESASPEAAVSARQQLAILRAAIEEMPPRTREVFLLFRLEGLRYREIAGRLGISPRTVEYHVQHAMTLCHRRLREPGRAP